MNYQNFDLEIIFPQGGGRLCARVLASPQGDCPFVDVTWPFNVDEEDTLLADIYGGLRQRRARSSKTSTVQDFGGKLFDAVFTGDIEHLYRSSLAAAARANKGLRVRLRLPEDSAVHAKPWEFLFDTENREFLAVREQTPLVRYLPVAQPIPPISVEGPLRVLVALSAPTDHPRLDTTREWEILQSALELPIAAGQIELCRVPGRCTFDNLRDSLRHFGAHIFHFVGHGIPGALVLEQESGKGLEMEATHLRSAFPSGMLPRLVVLNACSGALDDDVPFSGLAQGFLKQGVPAVVAMQASITDDAAVIFTRYFYRDLVETGVVDASLTEARLRMKGNGHPIEWGTPVLYMRALNGQLFQPGQKERKKSRDTTGRENAAPRREPNPYERARPQDAQARNSRPPPSRPETDLDERNKPYEIQQREMEAREKEAREKEAREKELREQEQRERELREQELRENALREQEQRENELREQELREKGLREQEQREKALREQALREKELQEKALREKELREKALQEKALQEKALQEKALREKEAQESEARERERQARQNFPSPQPEPTPVEQSQRQAHQAGEHAPMARLEPHLNPQNTAWTTSGTSAVPAEDAQSESGKKRLFMYGMAASLLAAVIGIAIGWNRIDPPKVNPSKEDTSPVVNPQPEPVPAAPLPRSSTARNTEPTRINAQPDGPVNPGQKPQANVSDNKPSGPVSGKTSPVRKLDPRAGGNCKDPDVNKRSFTCVLPK